MPRLWMSVLVISAALTSSLQMAASTETTYPDLRVVVIYGMTLSTLATTSQRLEATITTAVVSASGGASVTVNTPSGNSGDLGCVGGGTSRALVLTIT